MRLVRGFDDRVPGPGEFADYGVVDGDLIAFIEVERVKSELAAKQLRPVAMYAVNPGI